MCVHMRLLLFNALSLIACPPMTCSIMSRPMSLELSHSSSHPRQKKDINSDSPRSSAHHIYNSDISLCFPVPSLLLHFFLHTLFSLLLTPHNLSLLSPLSITLRLPRPLLQQSPLPLAQLRSLSVVHALQPVSEARSAKRIDGVRPQRGAVEEGAHLDADLPEAHGEACRSVAEQG